MTPEQSRIWRALFTGGGALYLVGAFNHPRGMAMADMLVDSAWIPAHATVFVGLLLITLGLVTFRRACPTSPRMSRWLFYTIVLTVLETLEMGLHTLAYVDAGALDHESLHGGLSTPVLTIHMLMATLVYTPFAVALIGLIWIGQSEGSLGSPWIGWVGFIGAAAHGSVMWLVVVLGIGGAGILFPIAAIGISLWFILAGLWPTRKGRAQRVS